jgi:hypothetical protein
MPWASRLDRDWVVGCHLRAAGGSRCALRTPPAGAGLVELLQRRGDTLCDGVDGRVVEKATSGVFSFGPQFGMRRKELDESTGVFGA